MAFDIDKIREKIKAAIILSDDSGATEAEAIAAMDTAIRLAEKYGLSLEDIQQGNLKRSDYVSQSFKDGRKKLHEIDLYLSNALSEFCAVVIYRDHIDGDVKYFGHIADVELARYLRDTLFVVSKREWRLYHAKFPKKLKIHGNTLRRDFFLGFAERMKERMVSIKQEAAKVSEQTTALVLIKNQLVQAAFDDEQGKKLEGGKSVEVDAKIHPHNAGREAANKVQLNQSVENNKQERIE
jgi:hypothetical protein